MAKSSWPGASMSPSQTIISLSTARGCASDAGHARTWRARQSTHCSAPQPSPTVPGVIGVVLSGYLDDGAAGLAAIKSCGGTVLVQDPADASAGEMPQAALNAIDVDHCAP